MGRNDNFRGDVGRMLRRGPGPTWDMRGGAYARMPRGRTNYLEPDKPQEPLPIEQDHDIENKDSLPIEDDHAVEQQQDAEEASWAAEEGDAGGYAGYG